MTMDLRFGNIVISDSAPVVVIAEAACEHRGDLDEARRLVDLAKEAGADIVKFQLHLPEEEMIQNSIRFWAGSMDEVLARVNLPAKDHEVLMRHCQTVGIQYLCTPFCAKAADILDELGLEAFKTGSGEMTNIPMLRHIARKKKPMIVSTGMANVDEIQETVDALRKEEAAFMLMNCTSAYPPRAEEVKLGFIPVMRQMFGTLVGYSDHATDMWAVLGAVAMGAKVIEKHFTPDRALKGPDHFISLEPKEFRAMVGAIRNLESALGADKKVHPGEEEVRRWAHHSVVTLCEIRAGVQIAPSMVGVKRPGWGVPAKHLEDFYGRIAVRDIAANSLLGWEDVRGGAA